MTEMRDILNYETNNKCKYTRVELTTKALKNANYVTNCNITSFSIK